MEERKLFPISRIDPNDTKVELNCRTVKPILLYFRERYGREKLEEFIYETKMNLDYLEDMNNWISYDYFCRLLARLVEYAGDPRAPFVAGTYSTKKGCYGSIGNFFSRLGTPAATYKLMSEFSSRYSKIGKVTLQSLKKNNCTIAFRYFKGYKQTKENCLNIHGILASVPTLWDLPLAKVKEVQCAADSADSCVYKASWHNRPSYLFGLWGLLAGLLLVYSIDTYLWALTDHLLFIFIPLTGYLIGRIKDYRVTIKDSIEVRERESGDLLESIETIERLNVELQDKVEQRTKELQKALVDLEKSQGQLVQSEKLASVGRLAAGMAHELNNPVGAIRNYIQDVLEEVPEGDSIWVRLRQAEKATGRCKKIVSELLTFARQSKDLQLIDINRIVDDAVSRAGDEVSNPKIRIIKELTPGLPKIRIDALQIQQVFMNILMNAADAVKSEGRILVTSSADTDTISVTIADTGEGMSEEIKDKIFDPFFTTKSPGKGMGLGLAISYNIIKRFNGDIQVESAKGNGTRFIVTLPTGNLKA